MRSNSADPGRTQWAAVPQTQREPPIRRRAMMLKDPEDEGFIVERRGGSKPQGNFVVDVLSQASADYGPFFIPFWVECLLRGLVLAGVSIAIYFFIVIAQVFVGDQMGPSGRDVMVYMGFCFELNIYLFFLTPLFLAAQRVGETRNLAKPSSAQTLQKTLNQLGLVLLFSFLMPLLLIFAMRYLGWMVTLIASAVFLWLTAFAFPLIGKFGYRPPIAIFKSAKGVLRFGVPMSVLGLLCTLLGIIAFWSFLRLDLWFDVPSLPSPWRFLPVMVFFPFCFLIMAHAFKRCFAAEMNAFEVQS